ncbi:hypothetical protein LLG95_06890 [bacterium]|nr:hypothetical protein [bacterium]
MNSALRIPHSALVICAALAVLALAGCASQGKILVPQQKNAAMQYGYAERMREQANLPIIFPDKKAYASERVKIYESWAAVVRNFPADREATPLAKINMIEMDAGLDDRNAPHSGATRKLSISSSVDRRAIEAYEALIKEYPENRFVQAKARYDQALIYKRAGDYAKATDLFKFLAENFGKDSNPSLKVIGQKSAAYYQETYVIGK